jgi:hypothetical protein
LLQYQYTFLEKLGFKLHILSNDSIRDHFPQIHAMQTDHLWGYEELVTALDLPNQMRSGLSESENREETSSIRPISKAPIASRLYYRDVIPRSWTPCIHPWSRS